VNDRAKAARGARSAAAVTTLLQSVCDRLPVGFALFDADLELAAWNARFAAQQGYPRKLVKTGTRLEAFIRFDIERGGHGAGAIDPLTRQRLAALKRGQRTEREQALPDGRILYIASELMPGAGVLLTCEDVTENRSNEERLRESAARYELALRGISEGFYDWDIANDTIHYSERVRNVLGLSPAELRTPLNWRRRVHPDDLARYDATHVAHFKGETERFECDYRYRGRDGSWRWARQHGVALRDAGGRAYRMVGSTGDITELKRVEEALRASEERYALAAAAATEGIYEWNVETDTLFLSDHAKAFFAFPAERLAPKDWNARIHPEDLEAYRHATVNHFKGRTPQLELEYRIRDAAGGYRWVLDRGIAVRSAKGRVTRLIGALSDITQRKRAETELRRARDEATAALAEQTALREVLEAISRSAFDLDAVLRTLIEHATRLLRAEKGFIFRLEGDMYRLAVDFGAPSEFREFIERNPIRADSGGVVGLAARAGRAIHIEDATTDPRFRWHESQRLGGFRTVVGVPMLRDGVVIGVIALWKERVEPFTQAQIDLVTTFSSQALIAIENARLFKETKEALEHQTATADILRVISSSPTDLQPVFEAIVESATRLCDSADASLYRAEGEVMRHVASHGVASTLGIGETRPITRGSVSGRSMVDRRPVHVPDLVATSAEYPEINPVVFRRGVRAALGVPLLREGVALGSIVIRRLEVRPFSDRQIALLKTFADQAVIAIENVRLFNELQVRNRELTESLEQQTATSRVLGAISSSPTDLAPVYQTILSSIARLCEANIAALFLYDGEFLTSAATHGTTPEFAEHLARGPFPPSRKTTTRLAALERRPVHVADLLSDPTFSPEPRDLYERESPRTVLSVPMLREDALIGVITTWRREVRPFTDKQVALVRTFADQAVIAIENVRLFNETKEALERQTATAEILKVISSSPTDTQPVFDAIITSASRLAGGCSVNVSRVVGDELHLAAYTSVDPAKDEILRSVFPVRLSEVRPIAEAVRRRSPFVVSDHETDPLASAKSRDVMRARGFRSTLYVPILHGDVVLGVMHVSKVEPGPFPRQSVELLTTFADQAAIAIENVRLFNETKEALDQQRASAEVLSAISSSIADARPVFGKILERCRGLFGGRLVGINLVGDDGLLGLAAYHGPGREELERVFPLAVDRESGSGRSIVDRCVIHYPDAQHGADVPDATRRGCTATGIKSAIFAPMLWEGRGIGAIFLGREHLGSFSEKEIGLLKTFADQAVIAIQNARLFREIQEKSHQLEIADQHKSAFLANMSHELRTPLNAVIGFSEMLAARYFGELTAKQAEYVNDIHGSGKHLLSLINDILDLSKIEAGRMELDLAEFDLRGALDNALTLVRERAQRGGVALRLETDPRLAAFRGDERKLKQVVLNLLSNAVKFTSNGGSVSVVAKQVDGAVEIAVRDTGVGIAPADQEAIFEAFRQVGTDVTRKREGTGLGLALTRRFVELHGGTIRVESAPGKGSTFTVRLPIRHGE
jgi:PAS domain S-box-containing protein